MGYKGIDSVFNCSLITDEIKQKIDQFVNSAENEADFAVSYSDEEIEEIVEDIEDEVSNTQKVSESPDACSPVMEKEIASNNIDSRNCSDKKMGSKLSVADTKKKKAIEMFVSEEDCIECVKLALKDLGLPSLEDKIKSISLGSGFGELGDLGSGLGGFGGGDFGFGSGGGNLGGGGFPNVDGGGINLSPSSLKLPSLKLPTTPTIPFPDDLPTVDIMADVTTDINTGIEEILSEVLVETTKMLLGEVYSSLFSSVGTLHSAKMLTPEFGEKNINNLFDFKNGGIEEALKELGLPTEIFLDLDPFNQPGENPASLGTAKDMMDDVSFVLTPLEIVDMMEGTANQETLSVVESVIADGYPTYMEQINRTSNVSDVFKSLGNFVDQNVLDSVRNTARKYPKAMSGLLCEDDWRLREDIADGSVGSRNSVLGGRMSDDCLRVQLREARKRKREKLKRMLDLLESDNILAGIMPPPIASCGEAAQSTNSSLGVGNVGGLIKRDHPSIEYLNDKVIKNIFDTGNMLFNSEVQQYTDSLIEFKSGAPQKGGYYI